MPVFHCASFALKWDHLQGTPALKKRQKSAAATPVGLSSSPDGGVDTGGGRHRGCRATGFGGRLL